ncbi:MAG TPA: redoxin domain-containing protein [Roseiflexaceae bacterium]|nr:redoxin domain-containing protein [Roseiflexaceae bacterium]
MIEPFLKRGQLVPNFTLPDSQGEPLRRSIYRGRQHLALVFLPNASDPAAHDYLRGLAARHAEIRAAAAEVLVILPAAPAELAWLRHELGLPFPLLSDANGETATRFLPQDAGVGLFVVDRYGELYYGITAPDVTGLPVTDEVPEWLAAVDNQCVI